MDALRIRVQQMCRDIFERECVETHTLCSSVMSDLQLKNVREERCVIIYICIHGHSSCTEGVQKRLTAMLN